MNTRRIIIGLIFLIFVSFVFLYKQKVKRKAKGNAFEVLKKEKAEKSEDINESNILDKAEIQVIDLLHLVETNNKKVFSEIIAYFENDKPIALKDYIETNPKSASRINDKYFNYLKRLMEDCYSLKPPTGNIETDYSFVVTDSKKIYKNNRTMIRVSLKYCLPDEVQCEDKICYFDFIPVGDQVYLLDINDAGLYK